MQKYFYICFRTKGEGTEWRILRVIECLEIIFLILKTNGVKEVPPSPRSN